MERLVQISDRTPANPSFVALNDERQKYHNGNVGFHDHDIQDFAEALINGATSSGAERTAGLVYHRTGTVTVRTNYNTCSFNTGGVEAVIRAFRGQFSGQEGRHFGLSGKVDSSLMESMGREAAETAKSVQTTAVAEPGKYRVLLSPYVVGNILSYSSSFLSYYSVETGLSCFADSIGKQLSSPEFSLHDDPADYQGVGARVCDDEGTSAGRVDIFDHGVLKSYLHSFSTAKRAGAKTTGNAGIITPRAWQLSLDPGTSSLEEMTSAVKDGIIINNAWYTRFQDYRNGVFSTVPRDGVFLVKHGEIAGSLSGIRISDSVTNILKNIKAISRETKRVKWWEEIFASSMPYVLADDVNISRAF